MLFTVRRTRVLRVEESTSIEVDASDRAEAVGKATEEEDEHQWVEVLRETTIVTTEGVWAEGEGP